MGKRPRLGEISRRPVALHGGQGRPNFIRHQPQREANCRHFDKTLIDSSCWSRGQAWMIHGYAQCALTTGNAADLAIAKRLAAKAEALMGSDKVPVWDFSVTDPALAFRESSAAAIMAAGAYLIAAQVPGEEAERWTAFGDRPLNGLLETCDLTADPKAHGMLAHGASHIPRGLNDTMLPYGDYYFMEALMRALGHRHFFW